MLKVYEVLIETLNAHSGVNAISLVDKPAIDSNWIALAKQTKFEFKEIDEQKHILMGAALIPNKPIYRSMEGNEFYILFSKDTIRLASELFFKNGKQSETTQQHEVTLKGNTVVESWIKEDMEKDKSAIYGLSDPVGTWMISMKIEDKKTYEKAKNGELNGFSIEGLFHPQIREELSKFTKQKTPAEKIEAIKELLEDV